MPIEAIELGSLLVGIPAIFMAVTTIAAYTRKPDPLNPNHELDTEPTPADMLDTEPTQAPMLDTEPTPIRTGYEAARAHAAATVAQDKTVTITPADRAYRLGKPYQPQAEPDRDTDLDASVTIRQPDTAQWALTHSYTDTFGDSQDAIEDRACDLVQRLAAATDIHGWWRVTVHREYGCVNHNVSLRVHTKHGMATTALATREESQRHRNLGYEFGIDRNRESEQPS